MFKLIVLLFTVVSLNGCAVVDGMNRAQARWEQTHSYGDPAAVAQASQIIYAQQQQRALQAQQQEEEFRRIREEQTLNSIAGSLNRMSR